MLHTPAALAWKRTFPSSCSAAVSATITSPGLVSMAWAEMATPMFPSTKVFRPAALKISPVRVVQVVLPLVPVMQTKSALEYRYPSSISEITSMPRRFASTMKGRKKGMMGLGMSRSTPSSRSMGSSPSLTS